MIAWPCRKKSSALRCRRNLDMRIDPANANHKSCCRSALSGLAFRQPVEKWRGLPDRISARRQCHPVPLRRRRPGGTTPRVCAASPRCRGRLRDALSNGEAVSLIASILSMVFCRRPGSRVLSAVGVIRRNIWSEIQMLQCPQRAGIQ